MIKKLAIVGLVGAAFAVGVYLGISSGHKSPSCAPAEPLAVTSRSVMSGQPAAVVRVPVAVKSLYPVDPTQLGPNTAWNQFQPERITLPVAGTNLTFKVSSIKARADGRTIWVGQAEEAEGVKLVSSGAADGYDAIVYSAGGSEVHYSIHNGKTVVREISADAVGGCAEALVPEQTAEAAEAVTMAGDTYTVNVMYVHTSKVAQLHGDGNTAYNAFVARIAAANQMLVDSGVNNVVFNLVAQKVLLDYTSDGTMATALRIVTSAGTTATSTEDTVYKERVDFLADFVVYEVSTDEASDYAGLAWMPTTPGFSSSFSVVNTAADTKSLLHEMAHNFGCNHDRVTASATGNSTGYNYGYTFGTNSGTIMSYAGNRVPYFSNPNLTYEGTALGIAAGLTNAADNARWIREKAAAAASVLSSTYTPTISTQPAGQTVVVGGTITLSVVAAVSDTTGAAAANAGDIRYQWRKDYVDIDGATSSTYTKTGAAVADGGVYTVLVYNNLGSVVSYNATVVVNTADAPVITTQPVAQTITAGDTLTLSVVATGSSLTYQWYIGSSAAATGTAISGATSATYTKSSITTSYSGYYYHCVVTNSYGDTPSNSVLVTVNAASYSSGGGGAPSLWFFAALAAVGGMRLLRRKK